MYVHVSRVDALDKFLACFLFCSGDFDVHYDADFANTSVFHLLEKACVFLMKESQKMKQRGVQGFSQHHSLLFKMIWRKFFGCLGYTFKFGLFVHVV